MSSTKSNFRAQYTLFISIMTLRLNGVICFSFQFSMWTLRKTQQNETFSNTCSPMTPSKFSCSCCLLINESRCFLLLIIIFSPWAGSWYFEQLLLCKALTPQNRKLISSHNNYDTKRWIFVLLNCIAFVKPHSIWGIYANFSWRWNLNDCVQVQEEKRKRKEIRPVCLRLP